MSPSIEEYELVIDGWRWNYELNAARFIAVGVRGEERQYFEFQLMHAHPIPNRGVQEYGIRFGCDRHSQSSRVDYAAWKAGHSLTSNVLVFG
jgi:hypothetical protein